MQYLNDSEELLSPIIENIKTIISIFFPTLVPKDASLLFSTPSNVVQTCHCDYDVKSVTKFIFDRHCPLSVLVALEDNSKLIIFPKSHSYVWKILKSPTGTFPALEPIQGISIDIPRNSAIIFRQDFVHSGEAYEMENLRLHIYFDYIKNQKYIRIRDSTFTIDQMGRQALTYFKFPVRKNSTGNQKKPNPDDVDKPVTKKRRV